ncbi:histidine phosphatase family protein [Thiocystis violacea]|uniref:histidine phosphatase family protein n=1 Tax=Thiocystis violacea TaxID=13725 RepID=UPI0019084EE7|nr:histidine phosphatase family protein [Thiocystis violacea]MBK1718375.1 histidine phosphatase family protein [Thiocystis violacea]
MKTPTELCVTRHGETDWNIAGILQGWIDVPLNENGRRQSRELAEALTPANFSSICSSPLQRSLETAEIIAATWGLPSPLPCEGLKERHFGRLQGMPKDDVFRLYPDLHREILRRCPTCDFAEGESMDHFADRVIAGLRAIAERHAGGRVLVITHGWVMDVITREVRDLPRDAVLDMKRGNGESIWLRPVGGTDFAEIQAPEPGETASGR